MHTLLVRATAETLTENMPLENQIGVCYHCRQTVWDGIGSRWDAPHTCTYCQQPLTLALQTQHRSRTEANMLSYLFADDQKAGFPKVFPFLADQEKESTSLEGKRAVIVEDEGITQLQISKMLRSHGIKVVGVASNGQEGVEIVLKESPDFVLMDIRMPGMDGIEAAARILTQYRVCIVMLTAFSDETYQQQAANLGACAYVLKPVTEETLMPQLQAAYHRFHHAS